MLRQVEYHPHAKAEIRNSANWYDKKVDGLGLEFMLEVKAAESKIIDNPESWASYEQGTRRYIMKRFPYSIIYLLTAEKIQIVAVAHSKRRPEYWKNRID
ncbi:type II toxin-antitoxin system RelE/ParE family toxin [candidate division KSB1 bacterium]|nr:type II toxin-antitoxin system RelE/ParE family toxin [candidate division KSB1 bacterium]